MTTKYSLREVLAHCEETHEVFFTSWRMRSGKLYLVDRLGLQDRFIGVARFQTRGGNPQATFEFSRGGGNSVKLIIFADGSTSMAREDMKFIVKEEQL